MFDGKLPEPSSKLEHDTLINIVSSSTTSQGSLWLGFNDFKKFGHFVTDSDGNEMQYSDWAPMYPWRVDRGHKHCVIMHLVRISSLSSILNLHILSF